MADFATAAVLSIFTDGKPHSSDDVIEVWGSTDRICAAMLSLIDKGHLVSAGWINGRRPGERIATYTLNTTEAKL